MSPSAAPTPADSPMLRRPDLLRSLVTYWQHHPSLSYLFSGLFIGPTSQAPRVDEARNETLYELEIAFQQIPRGEVPQPWLVDRVLRHLLVDITGNTHRAEFCIDKLYSPDSATGRLGLVELRAFEMPPHARMSLVQMLLLRALVARFWQKPYPTAAGALGHRAARPFHAAALCLARHASTWSQDLQREGYRVPAGMARALSGIPLSALRPRGGAGYPLELRMAIEPWHVLGEEVTSVGTARFVDSSVERLQVQSHRADRFDGTWSPATAGGCRCTIPAPTASMSPVCVTAPGSRPRRCIRLSACMSPLVFDIIDTWNGRSIGGCTYHTAHPGGRSYDVFPVNAYAAETRRVSRFWDYGHTPGVVQPPPEVAVSGGFFQNGHPVGPMAPPIEERSPEYPYTLDLRRRP